MENKNKAEMSMANIKLQKRILVVEDNTELRNIYTKNIKRSIENVEIDMATSQAEAISLIMRKTYHLLLLDIMLANDSMDRGGIEVLKYINELREGTVAIMLSGTADINCAIFSVRTRNVIDYIHKNEIKTASTYIDPIKNALNEVQIPLFGKYGRLASYMAAIDGSDVSAWEYNVMKTLNVSMDALNNALYSSLIPICPILDGNNEGVSIKLDTEQNSLTGHFWSKALGASFGVCLCTKEIGSSLYKPDKLFYSKNIKGINVDLWFTDNDRDDFKETIWSI